MWRPDGYRADQRQRKLDGGPVGRVRGGAGGPSAGKRA